MLSGGAVQRGGSELSIVRPQALDPVAAISPFVRPGPARCELVNHETCSTNYMSSGHCMAQHLGKSPWIVTMRFKCGIGPHGCSMQALKQVHTGPTCMISRATA